MSSWHSYPKIWALGHAAINELMFDEVLVEEKIDGSQFSFGRFSGELRVRSKGKEMVVDAPEKMFNKAVAAVKDLDLIDGCTYRGEYLSKPKHNALAYDRAPKNYIILFDINEGEEKYASYEMKKTEAERLGFETVPILHQGKIENAEDIKGFLEKTSILGGQKIEGVVIKNYSRFGRDKKVLMGKYVSEAFKEVHKKEWKKENKGQGDILLTLRETYRSQSRWNKAVQHLKEKGELENSPRDIGKLIVEVQNDMKVECADEIKERLYQWAIGHIVRGSAAGLPEWYKEKLLDSQFEEEA